MKFSYSFAAVTLASLLCAGASMAQQQAPAGLTEGMDPAIARRMAVEPAAPVVFNIPPATNEWLTWGYDQERTGWNRKAAARLLEVSYRTLLYKIEQYHMTAADRFISPLHGDRLMFQGQGVKNGKVS